MKYIDFPKSSYFFKLVNKKENLLALSFMF